MTRADSLRAYTALVSGLALQAVTASADAIPALATSILGLACGGLLVYGCAIVAERKGYSSWLGLAGLLSVVGVVVVVLLPPSDAFPRPWRRNVLPTPERAPGPGVDARKPPP